MPASAPAECRVLHVVSATTFSGIERHVLHLSAALRELGGDAQIACPPAAARLRAEAAAAGIAVRPAAGCRNATWPAALARRLGGVDGPNVVHVHDGQAALIGALLPAGGAPLVRTQHFLSPASTERGGWRQGVSLALHRALNRRLAAYVAISRAVADAASARGETGDAELVVIAPAIALPGEPAVARARAARAALAHPVVAFAGRLVRERRLDVLLRAIPLVRAQLPDCHFVIAGTGEDAAELHGLARELGLGEPALTWTGWVDDAYAVLGGAHVYVNTWSQEGFGMATAEAMALALPVVAADAGANAELVADGVTGRLVAPGDASALAAAIAGLLGDRAAAARMGEAARAHVVARYGARRSAEASLALYRRLLAGAGAGAPA